jgi:hypothetical protein
MTHREINLTSRTSSIIIDEHVIHAGHLLVGSKASITTLGHGGSWADQQRGWLSNDMALNVVFYFSNMSKAVHCGRGLNINLRQSRMLGFVSISSIIVGHHDSIFLVEV